jgi:hypothetical protein
MANYLKSIYNFNSEKSSRKIWSFSVIFIKLPKVNKYPIGRRKYAQSSNPDSG